MFGVSVVSGTCLGGFRDFLVHRNTLLIYRGFQWKGTNLTRDWLGVLLRPTRQNDQLWKTYNCRVLPGRSGQNSRFSIFLVHRDMFGVSVVSGTCLGGFRDFLVHRDTLLIDRGFQWEGKNLTRDWLGIFVRPTRGNDQLWLSLIHI